MARFSVPRVEWWKMSPVVTLGRWLGVTLFVLTSGTSERRCPRRSTPALLVQVRTALQSYAGNSGRHPSTSDGLGVLTMGSAREKELESVAKDNWGSTLIYAMPPAPQDADKPFTLRSAGPDRITFTADDINVWTLFP